jgi:predicted transcriptional regulator
MREQFDFSQAFQDLILACLIRHSEDFARYGPILEPRYFLGIQATVCANSILDYQKQRGKFPSFEVLEQLVINYQAKIGGDEEAKERAGTYVQRLSELDTSDHPFVIEQVCNFARERATLAAIKASLTDIQAGKLGPEFTKRLEEALRVGQDLEDLGILLHRDAESAVRMITAQNYGIRTGYQLFDDVWKNGLGPGWLVVFLAPPKRYKTAMCLNLAINAISPSIGEDVFYYTLEISQELALARALFKLTGLNQEYMFMNTDKFIIAANKQIQMTVAGNLLIKGFGSKTARISDIENHAKTVIQQLKIRPKMIIIDYAETVAEADKTASEHQRSASVYTEARAMGHRLKCPVIMPDRCNKETVGLSVPNMTSFQGAFQKAGIVDAAIGICATEAEYVNNTLRWFIFENRHGPAYQHFRGKVDPDTMSIEINEKIAYEPQDDIGKQRRRKSVEDALPDDLKEA